LELRRYPHRPQEQLQAWDAADELILEHLAQAYPSLEGKRILIINDRFGALSCALEGLECTSYTDSYVSCKSTQDNSQERLTPLSELAKLSGIFDIVLIQIPKNMSYFEDVLCHLTQHLQASSQVICGYRIKHQAAGSFRLIADIIGETSTSLAKKKARLIFARFQKTPTPSRFPIQVRMEGFETPFLHHSNLFSREKMDVGTRFFLEHIPRGPFKTILDLGCANGVIGIAAKRENPMAKILFTDESRMAIQSSESNYRAFFQDQAEFCWTHAYQEGRPASVDLVLCNPPFHQDNTVGDFIAEDMFRDAQRVLTPGGKLRIIGNLHLQYRARLKAIFGNSQVVAQNAKFIVLDAHKG